LGEDQFGEGWDDGACGNRQPGTEIIPERDVELGAGLDDAEEGVATVAADIAAGAAADLAPGDMAADVILRSVGVQGDLRPVEHHQQFGLVGVEPGEQTIEGHEASFAREDAIEPYPQRGLASSGRSATIGLEIAVEVPDQVTDGGLGGAVLFSEGVELVN